jgi:hypothetical protein
MSEAKKYRPNTSIKNLVDREGEAIFSEEEVELLHEAEFYTLQDLFLHRSESDPYANSRFDSKAKQAKSLLLEFNPNSNRLHYIFDDLCEAWRKGGLGLEENIKKENLRRDASRTVPRTVTAPVGRQSRMTRVVKYIPENEIFDLIGIEAGVKCSSNRGDIGFYNPNEDEYGYNG